MTENEKRKEVLQKLQKSAMYFNEICKDLGSRSSVASALTDLSRKGIIEYEWTMIEKDEDNPGKFGAVKMFHIKKEYVAFVKKLNL